MSMFENGGTPNGASASQSADLATEAKSPNLETFDWDSLINGDTQPNPLFPEGDYRFKTIDFTRGRFPGSEKLPPAPKAILTLRLMKDDGTSKDIKTDIILAKALEWKISSYFRAIGQKKKGEEFKMDWNAVIGAEGCAHIKQRTFRGNDGKDHTVNEVDYYIDPVEDSKQRTTFDPGPDRQY